MLDGITWRGRLQRASLSEACVAQIIPESLVFTTSIFIQLVKVCDLKTFIPAQFSTFLHNFSCLRCYLKPKTLVSPFKFRFLILCRDRKLVTEANYTVTFSFIASEAVGR